MNNRDRVRLFKGGEKERRKGNKKWVSRKKSWQGNPLNYGRASERSDRGLIVQDLKMRVDRVAENRCVKIVSVKLLRYDTD